MGGGRTWFGKKQQDPGFRMNSSRYTGASNATDPELAEYKQQQDTDSQQGQEQSQAQPAATYQSSSSGVQGNASNAEATGNIGIPRDRQLYPVVDETGRATVVQGQQVSGKMYPEIGGNQMPGGQVHPEPAAVQYTEQSGAVAPENATVLAQSGLAVGPKPSSKVEAHEEELVRIPSAMVHLIGNEGSLLLTSGDFRVLRITQEGKGVMAMVRVGKDMQWPLGWDEPVFKIDSNRYVFTLRFTKEMDDELPRAASPPSPPGELDYKVSKGTAMVDGKNLTRKLSREGSTSGRMDDDEMAEVMSYGVTFTEGVTAVDSGKLDTCLEQYCIFSQPQVVAKEGVGSTAAATTAAPPGAATAKGGRDQRPAVLAASSANVDAAAKLSEASASAGQGQLVVRGKHLKGDLKSDADGTVVPTDPEERQLAEKNGEYWTTIAPNVDEYRGSVAKGIASGSGGMIQGIFYVSDAASKRLEKMGTMAKERLKERDPNKPVKISPAMMRSMRNARKLSRMTAKVADGVLAGVVTTTGFVTGRVIKNSLLSTAVSKVIPGEVAVVSLEAFGRVFDAVELAGKNVLQTTSVVTSGVVSHKYGVEAGELAAHGLATTGHMIHTAWTVSKVRKAMTPSSKSVVSNTGLKTTMVRNAVEGVRKAAKK